MLGAVDHGAGHHAVLQHPPVIVDVAQEQVQRLDALGQARFQPRPFRPRDNARDQVGGNDPLGGLVVVIDGEGDALMQEALLAGLLAAVQFLQRQGGQPRVHRRIGRARRTVGCEHLVIGAAQFIVGIGGVLAGAGDPGRTGHDVGPAEVLRIGENFMLHTRSLHRRRRTPQACWPGLPPGSPPGWGGCGADRDGGLPPAACPPRPKPLPDAGEGLAMAGALSRYTITGCILRR